MASLGSRPLGSDCVVRCLIDASARRQQVLLKASNAYANAGHIEAADRYLAEFEAERAALREAIEVVRRAHQKVGGNQ